MRIDSSGNLLVGKTSANNPATVGTELRSTLSNIYTVDGAVDTQVAIFNRLTNDGDIINFRKDGATVGSIGANSGTPYMAGNLGGFRLTSSGGQGVLIPTDTSGNASDDDNDLGIATARWDDIYATNGTIQTSDRNEKQDIQAITEAESRVAQACKGLLQSFRWKSAVAEKGDDARIHFGIIAQDLQAAFEAEGLDAGRYAMFISSTWYEKEIFVDAQDAVYETVVVTPAVEAQEAVMGERQVTEIVEVRSYVNLAGETIVQTEERGVTATELQTAVEIVEGEDGVWREVEVEREVQVPVMESYEVSPAVEAVAEVTEQHLVSEAKEAYTYTDTKDEPTKGYTERTRLGVRYPELLAFISAADDAKVKSLESRVTTLESQLAK